MSILPQSRVAQAVLGILGLLLTLLLFAPGLFVEFLWMSELGFQDVYWTILGTQATLFSLVLGISALYFLVNFRIFVDRIPPMWATQWGREGEGGESSGPPITQGRIKRIAYIIGFVLSLLFAAGFAGQWDGLLRYLYAVPYGQTDPVYNLDLGFYLLELPFVQALQSGLVGLAFLGLLTLVTGYILAGEIGVQDGQFRLRSPVVQHLGVNVIVLLIGWAWGFYLDRYEVLMEGGGAVFGAGYTDIHVTIPALWVMVGATLFLALLVGVNLFQRRLRVLGLGVAAYVVTLVIVLVVAPTVVTQFTVTPNELEVETPFIEDNIELTREAFGLSDIQETSYPARTNLTPEDIQNNRETIRNIRLWDPRLLIDTYSQLQQIRLYYQFYNVDVDRYQLEDGYRQVMLSARELTQQLPSGSNNWVNQHLQFTHGYGAVANLVAREGTEGSPDFLVKDLPPVAADSALAVDQPAIYYAEAVSTYRLVNTNEEEFAFPQGDENRYVSYAGSGGVLLDSFWKELLFAYYLGDFNILLSDYINDESRIQIFNRIQERVRKITPFLQLDADPYFVLNDNRQYWMQDAYTTSRSFPYSESIRGFGQYNGIKYIRNSVKTVIDAYEGDVDFYIAEPDDPLIQTYQKIFPGLFRPMDEMPEGLQSHVRYPQDLFEIQIERYRRYHMTTPRVFYNNEDLWTRPREQYDTQSQRIMEPYYIMSKLPGEDLLQFMLMTPMTPDNRDNMIAWIAAKSDPPNYGEVEVYKLPKEKLIYGPNQVESRIDQNPEISQQLSLWDQQGSRVVRGNLIVVPIEESFLYVEPIYLIAENLKIPQLRRVIVAYGENVSMERTLREALNVVLGREILRVQDDIAEAADLPTPAPGSAQPSEAMQELREARSLLEEARSALQDGDFAQFGDRLDALEAVLDRGASQSDPVVPADTTQGVPTTPVSGSTE